MDIYGPKLVLIMKEQCRLYEVEVSISTLALGST
jgi:hypothetical protein